jgi:hypothetical protein
MQTTCIASAGQKSTPFLKAKPSIMTPFSAFVNDRIEKFSVLHKKVATRPVSKSQAIPHIRLYVSFLRHLAARLCGSCTQAVNDWY